MNCHVYHLPLRLASKIKRASQKGATFMRFDNKLVKSLGLIFFKKLNIAKACHQVMQPSSYRIV